MAVRVTASDDLSQRKTKVALHKLLRLCKLYEVGIDVWVAIPCTSGSPWAKVNALRGIQTGDPQLTDKLIDGAVSICRHAKRIGGGVHWEWSAGNELWKDERVQCLLKRCNTLTSMVSTAAVGQTFPRKLNDPEAGVFYVKKKWRIETTSKRLAEILKPYDKVPKNIPETDFRQCCGRVCSGSSYYTPLLAQLAWSAFAPRATVAMPCVVPITATERVLPRGRPQLPLWCAMITRTISIKSQEGQSDKAKAAVKAEVDSHAKRGTWDIQKVREVSEWMKDPYFTEVLVGRAFVIVGAKFSEDSDQSDIKYKARMVYQGNNIWTRSGRTVYEIFDEVSNSPSSLASARAAMAVGLVLRMSHTYRDATDAFLQAKLDADPKIINLVELPRDMWPDSWFTDKARTVAIYRRPAVPLTYALPGHPKSGNVWEDHVEVILIKYDWRSVEQWNGIFVHPDHSILCVYVDDFLLIATKANADKHWLVFAKEIFFKELSAPVKRYLGAAYHIDEYSEERPQAARSVVVSMEQYLLALVRRFAQDNPELVLNKVTSPFVPDAVWGDPNEEAGVFQPKASSYVASALFASLVGRPDLSTAVRRLSTRVTRWTVPDDAAMIRMMAYCKWEAGLELKGTLAPDDEEDLTLILWTDADWNGDPSHTRSVSGAHIEVVGMKSGNTFPITWRAGTQGATSNSSAESEVVALSMGVRHIGLPMQDLFEAFLGRRIPMVCRCDNTQAIAAAKKGYSKKLRCLNRTHRISISALNEIFADESQCCSIEWIETAKQKANIYTKALGPAQFVSEREMVGMIRGGKDDKDI